MKLIVGLGNPGAKYKNTRHNMGYMVVDEFISSLGLTFDRAGFNASYVIFKVEGENIIVLKPETYMNLSGESVKAVVDYFNIPLEDIIIIYDDMDLNVGTLRIKEKGSSGGQKGMQSIIEKLKSEEIKRIRVGIGKPEFGAIDYVLGKISKEDIEKTNETIKRASNALKEYLKNGFKMMVSKYSGGN